MGCDPRGGAWLAILVNLTAWRLGASFATVFLSVDNRSSVRRISEILQGDLIDVGFSQLGQLTSAAVTSCTPLGRQAAGTVWSVAICNEKWLPARIERTA
jgi:hypothetical protein